MRSLIPDAWKSARPRKTGAENGKADGPSPLGGLKRHSPVTRPRRRSSSLGLTPAAAHSPQSSTPASPPPGLQTSCALGQLKMLLQSKAPSAASLPLHNAYFFIRCTFYLSLLWNAWQDRSLCLAIYVAMEVVISDYLWNRKESHQPAKTEMVALIDKLARLDANEIYNVQLAVPESTAFSYCWVRRDGRWRKLATVLLVPGDVIKVDPLNAIAETDIDASLELVKEFPLKRVLGHHRANRKFMYSEVNHLIKVCAQIATIALSWLHANTARPSLAWTMHVLASGALEYLWCWLSNAYLTVMIDKLAASTTPYREKAEDIDEFDQDLPPPTKDLHVSVGEFIKQAVQLQVSRIVEALGLVSVLAFLDREGPISNSFPRLCELIIPTADVNELAAIELAPVITDRIAVDYNCVKPNLRNVDFIRGDLRALGLAVLMTAGNCEAARGKEEHCAPHCHKQGPIIRLDSTGSHLQTCYCGLARSIGFDPSIFTRFRLLNSYFYSSINVSAGLIEDCNAVTIMPKNFFAFGSVSAILKNCSYAYIPNIVANQSKGQDFTSDSESSSSSSTNSSSSSSGLPSPDEIVPLTDSLTRKLLDFEATMSSCDVDCIAYCYRPIFSEEEQAVSQAPPGKCIFLGILSACHEPREHFQEFVDDLEAAGIRFAYFSPSGELACKAFGERLGLETDWNSCVLLSELNANSGSNVDLCNNGYLALSDIKARLPRGVSTIRTHLTQVDDIPLHVSLFGECSRYSAAEMQRIYSENGALVGVIGSVQSLRNEICFAAAQLAIGINASDPKHDTLLLDDLATCLLQTFMVDFTLPADCSPYVILEIIREARTLLQTACLAWKFFMGANLSLLIVSVTVVNLDSRFVNAINVVLALSLAIGPHDPLVMKYHPPIDESPKFPDGDLKAIFVFIVNNFQWDMIRLLPILLLMVTILAVQAVVGDFDARPMLQLFMVAHSASYLHAIENSPAPSKPWMAAVTGALLFTASSAIVNVKEFLILVLVGWIPAGSLLYWERWIKAYFLADLHVQAQKRANLLFNTKLGMHSPV